MEEGGRQQPRKLPERARFVVYTDNDLHRTAKESGVLP